MEHSTTVASTTTPPPPNVRALARYAMTTSVFFIVYKGAKGLGLDDTTLSTAFAWAFGLGIGVGLLMVPTVLPYMRKQIAAKFNDDGTLKPVRSDRARCIQEERCQTPIRPQPEEE